MVSLRNRERRDVVVTSVRASVLSVTTAGAAGGPRCRPEWYRIAGFTGRRAVARGATERVELRVTFLDDPTVDQDDCKGARYSYSISASARSA